MLTITTVPGTSPVVSDKINTYASSIETHLAALENMGCDVESHRQRLGKIIDLPQTDIRIPQYVSLLKEVTRLRVEQRIRVIERMLGDRLSERESTFSKDTIAQTRQSIQSGDFVGALNTINAISDRYIQGVQGLVDKRRHRLAKSARHEKNRRNRGERDRVLAGKR